MGVMSREEEKRSDERMTGVAGGDKEEGELMSEDVRGRRGREQRGRGEHLVVKRKENQKWRNKEKHEGQTEKTKLKKKTGNKRGQENLEVEKPVGRSFVGN